jgi:hypothetical protein
LSSQPATTVISTGAQRSGEIPALALALAFAFAFVLVLALALAFALLLLFWLSFRAQRGTCFSRAQRAPVLALAFLSVIPEGNLLLAFAVACPSDAQRASAP